MAEFSEVMRQWVRSRKAINENKLSCCPLEMFTDDYIANIEKEVMEWAAENPEPVYPTWREYLTSIGVIPKAVILATEKDEFNTFGDWEEAYALTNKRIPADIAEKLLGIEPSSERGIKTTNWINVNDSLPEAYEDVLVYAEWESAGIDGISKGEGVKIGWQVDGHWHIDGRCRVVAKYWMAIPELAKEGT